MILDDPDIIEADVAQGDGIILITKSVEMVQDKEMLGTDILNM